MDALLLTNQGFASLLLVETNWQTVAPGPDRSLLFMPLTPKTAFQVLSDFSVNRWLPLHSLQKDKSRGRQSSASRIHWGALSCSFTRWGSTGLRELICFSACFVDCIWPDVPLCGLPNNVGGKEHPRVHGIPAKRPGVSPLLL